MPAVGHNGPCISEYPSSIRNEVNMARTNFQYEKRQRELEKKRKAEEKAKRKQEAKHEGGSGDGGEGADAADAAARAPGQPGEPAPQDAA
jgi:hypothetical protein